MTTSRTAKLATFLTLLASSEAFAPSARVQRQSLALSATSNDVNDGWKKMAGGAAGFLTGLGFMAQVAFADPSSISSVDYASPTQVESSSLIVSIGAPSFGGGQSFETLDFSLPSYDQAVSGGDVAKPAAKETPEDDGAAKAAEKAAKEEAAAAERAAKEEARKAAAEKKEAERAEKAAAEAKKQEEADAKAKKEADKAARIAAEKEKQRQAVERQKAAKEESAAPAISVPDLKDISVPNLKDIKIPDIPKIEVPKIDIPKVEAPKFDAPKPKLDAPKFDAPKFDAPKVPDFKAPDVKLPSFSMPKVDVPKIDVPAVPSFDMPKTPAAPSFNVPSKSAAPAAFDAPGESQEARDARAAAKKADFKDADSVARASITCEAEKAAKIARDKANEMKKEFKAAKAEACATRPGGKLLCLRGFGVGY
ncbi:hypothetical protein ACHAXN_005195 [Cyclotella atomus]